MSKILVKAVARNVAMTPRKVGEVASLVRGRTVADALVILEHTPRRAATPVSKAIASAKANASHNHDLKADTLTIETIHVSPAARMKRYRPVARGMAHPYQKRSSHITVIVTGDEKPKRTPKEEVKS